MSNAQRWMLLSLGLTVPTVTAAQGPVTAPRSWKIDSTEDHFGAELRSTEGQFSASLTLDCSPRSPVKAYQGPHLQIWASGVLPKIVYDKGPNTPPSRIPVTQMTLRFDTTEARAVGFVVGDGGETDTRSLGPYKLLWNADSPTTGWFEKLALARDTLVRRLRAAHRLRIELLLNTNQTVSAEFDLGSDTRAVSERVYQVCKTPVP